MSTAPSKSAPSKKTSAPATTLTGLADAWVEVFKAGSHVASDGTARAFSRADVDQMVANHALGAAPAVLGHPKHDAPAYAWVGEYKRDGDGLFAKFKDINPAFEQGVKTGAYRNRSVSVYKDAACGWRVRHVGWLGAAPPAIDGLACNFAAPEAECLEFSAPGYSLVWGLEEAARVFRSLRDQMIATQSLEAADAVLPQWRIDAMLEAVATARAEFKGPALTAALPQLFTQSPNLPNGDEMNFTQADLDQAAADATAKAVADAAAVLEASKADFAKSQADLLTLQNERRAERIDLQIADFKAKGVITPADESGLAEFMAAQEDGSGDFTFSKAEGGESKTTRAAWFTNFMANRKPVIKLGSTTEPEADPVDTSTTAAITAAAHNFMAAEATAGRTVNAAAAVQYVMNKAAGK